MVGDGWYAITAVHKLGIADCKLQSGQSGGRGILGTREYAG